MAGLFSLISNQETGETGETAKSIMPQGIINHCVGIEHGFLQFTDLDCQGSFYRSSQPDEEHFITTPFSVR